MQHFRSRMHVRHAVCMGRATACAFNRPLFCPIALRLPSSGLPCTFLLLGIPFPTLPRLGMDCWVHAVDLTLVPAEIARTEPEICPSVILAGHAPDSSERCSVPGPPELHVCSIAALSTMWAPYDSVQLVFNPGPLRPLSFFFLDFCFLSVVRRCLRCSPRRGIRIDSLRLFFQVIVFIPWSRQTAVKLVHFTCCNNARLVYSGRPLLINIIRAPAEFQGHPSPR